MFKHIGKRLRALTPLEIFIVILVIASTVFLIKFFGIKKEYRLVRVEVIRKNWVENYDSYGYRVPFWLSDKLKVGQTERDSGGNTIATIVRIENYERGNEEAEVYLTLKLNLVLNRRTQQYTYKEKPFATGLPIQLTLGDNSVEGQIVDTNAPENGYPQKTFEVVARGQNITPWYYTKMASGQKMYNRATAEEVAQVLSVKLEPPTFQQVRFDNTGKFLQLNTEADNRDVTITAKINAYQIDNRWFFSGHQNLKIGGNIFLYTKDVNFYAFEIKSINEL
jgi:hypothetical protein